jgi:hypothetical protein
VVKRIGLEGAGGVLIAIRSVGVRL